MVLHPREEGRRVQDVAIDVVAELALFQTVL